MGAQRLCSSVKDSILDSVQPASRLSQKWSGWARRRKKGIAKVYLSSPLPPSRCLRVLPNKAWVSFPAAPPSLSERAWIVNALSVRATTPAASHGCKVLSVCWGEFYSRRPSKLGFCPLFGLLQLQQGEKSLFVLRKLKRPRWSWNRERTGFCWMSQLRTSLFEWKCLLSSYPYIIRVSEEARVLLPCLIWNFSGAFAGKRKQERGQVSLLVQPHRAFELCHTDVICNYGAAVFMLLFPTSLHHSEKMRKAKCPWFDRISWITKCFGAELLDLHICLAV